MDAQLKINRVTLGVKAAEVNNISQIFCQLELTPEAKYYPNGDIEYSLALTEDEYDRLNSAILRHKIKSNIIKGSRAATNALVNGTEYLAKDVIVPAGKVGATLALSAARIGVESSVIAGASLLNAIAEQTRKTSKDIAENKEYQIAKKDIKKAFKGIGNLFGFGNNSINISKE